jgi:hypothetical protein
MARMQVARLVTAELQEQVLPAVRSSPAGGAEAAGASGAPPSSEARRRSVMRICSAAACTSSSCGFLAYLQFHSLYLQFPTGTFCHQHAENVQEMDVSTESGVSSACGGLQACQPLRAAPLPAFQGGQHLVGRLASRED